MQDGMSLRDRLALAAGKKVGDRLTLYGELHAVLKDADGNVKKEVWKNQVQTYMLMNVADALSDRGEPAMSHMAVGTGTGQAVGDTILAAQIGVRYALDNGTPTHAAAVVTYHRMFAAGEGTGAIEEAGLFNDLTAGNMGLYNDSISFAKAAADSLELTWTLTVS